jgi:hypothetical protein
MADDVVPRKHAPFVLRRHPVVQLRGALGHIRRQKQHTVSRREIVRDLERLFSFAKADGKPLILPSFELVKYKYDPESNPDRGKGQPESSSFRYYVFPVAMYVTISACCFYVAFTPYKDAATGVELAAFLNPAGTLQGALTYAFLGGYVWSIQYLIRRISNFDLSPISFFLAFSHIV